MFAIQDLLYCLYIVCRCNGRQALFTHHRGKSYLLTRDEDPIYQLETAGIPYVNLVSSLWFMIYLTGFLTISAIQMLIESVFSI